MSQLPFRINGDWEYARPQVEELLRVLYEERIGGLKTSTSLIKLNDVLRLFAGAANLHLLMDDSGDEPEWVVPYEIGTFTRDMEASTADVAYTGVGFKPIHIIFIGHAPDAGLTIGFDNGTAHYCVYNITTTYANSSTYSIGLGDKDGGSQVAVVKTFDADGFTLTWTKSASPSAGNGTVFYLALR